MDGAGVRAGLTLNVQAAETLPPLGFQPRDRSPPARSDPSMAIVRINRGRDRALVRVTFDTHTHAQDSTID